MTADSFVVPAALGGERVDRAVALHTGWSRSEVQALVDRELVTVDGRVVAKSRRLEAGESVAILGAPEVGVRELLAEDVPLEVVYDDDDVVVIAKPAGLVVHPGAGNDHGTLVHGLLARYPDIAGVGADERPGIVHRLDRDTSGLLVCARTEQAYDSLVAQLAERSVERRYDALCWGVPEPRAGVIDAPIGRSQTRRTRMAVSIDGRDARTRYDVCATWARPGVARLTCTLETGRTHQIRVHLAAIGHPVVGDATYRGARQSLPMDRPFLHAAHLAFIHPVSHEHLSFDMPLPDDLNAVLAGLGRVDGAI
ncbi:MAG TPA: RluA family pseudouridine synthase [Acidimicrobiia bacterium]|jgi:23S rRNA pseudouridine1911/1915/1917 synthase